MDGVWYLGLLTIRPELQNKQIGRALLPLRRDLRSREVLAVYVCRW